MISLHIWNILTPTWTSNTFLRLSYHTPIVSFLSIVVATQAQIDMHYSSLCPLCHCPTELWTEGCEDKVQSISWGLTCSTMGYVDWMSQDIDANKENWRAILYMMTLSAAVFTQGHNWRQEKTQWWWQRAQPKSYAQYKATLL